MDIIPDAQLTIRSFFVYVFPTGSAALGQEVVNLRGELVQRVAPFITTRGECVRFNKPRQTLMGNAALTHTHTHI